MAHWYEHLLHNQSTLLLEARLLYTPGALMTSVPWQLDSAKAVRPVETSHASRTVAP